MSFQAYLDNIKEKTGRTSEDFKKAGVQRGRVLARAAAHPRRAWPHMSKPLSKPHAALH